MKGLKHNMATAVIMPRQGQSVESCLIGKWYKNKGDKVSAGDLLFTYETDKAAFEEEARADGILLDIFFEEGDDVPCLANVCVIGDEGESVEEFRPVAAAQIPVSSSTSGAVDSSRPGNPSVGAGMQNALSQAPPAVTGDAALHISPRAKRLAERTYADLRYAVPTGAGGRIIEQDVRIVLSQGYRNAKGDKNPVAVRGSGDDTVLPYSSEDVEIVALSNVRKYIAKAMHASLAESAQLTLHTSFDATDIFAYRKKLKALPGAEGKTGISVTDIIIYATARVLPEHKSINAHFLGDSMALFNNAHIGVAVDTPRGLLVPTIFNANSLSLEQLSGHTKEVFDKCKQGSIEPDLLKGASFTISNLGGMGIEMFTPILNPPQTGLLGVCNTIERLKDGKPYPALGLSITFDHRALDGADAARFLTALTEYLESFSTNVQVS